MLGLGPLPSKGVSRARLSLRGARDIACRPGVSSRGRGRYIWRTATSASPRHGLTSSAIDVRSHTDEATSGCA